MNFKNSIRVFIGLGIVMLSLSCEKPNEVPPRSQAFIKQYVMPQPVFLSTEERDALNKEREEYNKL